MEFRIFLISVFLVLFNFSKGNTVTKTITSKVVRNCPVYTINTQSCVNKGGVITFTTNAVGCKAPTCVYPQTTTTSARVVTSTSTKTVPKRSSTSSKGVPSNYKVTTTTTTTTTSSKVIPTSTKQICPVYTINTQSCVNNGGVFTFTTNAVGCKVPTCIYPQTTTTSSKVIPSSSNVITSTTKSAKVIPTSTKQNCPIYSINTQSCVNNGGVFTFTTNAVGCKAPTCVYPQSTTTSSKVVPSSSKVITTTTTTSSKVVPSSSNVITSTTTSSKVIPTSTKQICPVYTINTQSCVNNGGVFTFTTNAVGCKAPTCIYPQTTTTSSKVIPTSTKTVTLTQSSNDCGAVTVTVKEKITVTIKETVTVTEGSIPTGNASESTTTKNASEGSIPTGSATEQCAKKWQQCGGIGFSGPTCCESGSTCHEYDKYYSQCI